MKNVFKNNQGFSNFILVILVLSILTSVGYLIYARFYNPEQAIIPAPNSEKTLAPSEPVKIDETKPNYQTDIVFEPNDPIEEDRKNLNSDKINIIDSIEKDLFPNWELMDEEFMGYKYSRSRIFNLSNYLKNDSFEVALAGTVGYMTKDPKSPANPGGSPAGCLYTKPTKEGSKWLQVGCYQNPVDCRELDKYGLTYAQTVEWRCFDYERQIERK